MAGSWDGLIYGDYEAVMPLPYRKKYGFKYVYPPAFTQQIGITRPDARARELEPLFWQHLPGDVSFFEMNLNTNNLEPQLRSRITERKNYFLLLDKTYADRAEGYSRSARRNIRKAYSNGISVGNSVDVRDIIDIHQRRFTKGIGATESDYQNLIKLVDHFKEKAKAFLPGAINTNDELIAGSVFLEFKDRLYFVLNGNRNDSLETGATHLLMDHTIQKYSGKNYMIDFEGSDTASFARFYEQYGADQEIYLNIRVNRLPWPLSLFKN